MTGDGLPTLARVKLTDLIASDGLPSDAYRLSIAALSQSLAQYSAAIIQLPVGDGALLRSCLESARLYFHQKPSYSSADTSHTNDSREWCKTSGYYADPHLWQETYDFRPGLTLTGPNNEYEFSPAGLADIFVLLAKATRDILDAISFYLNLRSSAFAEILDNVPLRNHEISSSVLSVSCHGRSSFQGAQNNNLASQEDDHLAMLSEPDKSMISLIKSDKAGLHVKDYSGQWVLVDGDLGPEEAIICTGLALYHATAGYVSPALYRTDIGDLQGNTCGRCSLSLRLMPKSMTSLNCSEMRAAGHGVESQFQVPVLVDDFMQRSHPIDQLFNRHNFPSFSFPPAQDSRKWRCASYPTHCTPCHTKCGGCLHLAADEKSMPYMACPRIMDKGCRIGAPPVAYIINDIWDLTGGVDNEIAARMSSLEELQMSSPEQDLFAVDC